APAPPPSPYPPLFRSRASSLLPAARDIVPILASHGQTSEPRPGGRRKSLAEARNPRRAIAFPKAKQLSDFADAARSTGRAREQEIGTAHVGTPVTIRS